MLHEQLQQMYRKSGEAVRGQFGGDERRAVDYFSTYVAFVERAAAPLPSRGAAVLDIGSGAGWSSYLFAQHGHETTDVDLNVNFFEPPSTPDLLLREASGSICRSETKRSTS